MNNHVFGCDCEDCTGVNHLRRLGVGLAIVGCSAVALVILLVFGAIVLSLLHGLWLYKPAAMWIAIVVIVSYLVGMTWFRVRR